MTSIQPGWYPDPDGNPCQRYWDGSAWTASTAPMPESTSVLEQRVTPRKPYLWRLVWLPFAIGALIFLLLPIHESVLGTDVNCGGAFSAIDKTATQAAIDAGIGDLAQSIADECNSDGKTHLYIAGGIVVAGLAAVGVAKKWERERA